MLMLVQELATKHKLAAKGNGAAIPAGAGPASEARSMAQAKAKTKVPPKLKAHVIRREWCKGCGICVAFCPKSVLELDDDEKAAEWWHQASTGGGALLGGFDQRLSHETGMPIQVAQEPLYSVVIGSGRALENIDAMRGLMSLGGDD